MNKFLARKTEMKQCLKAFTIAFDLEDEMFQQDILVSLNQNIDEAIFEFCCNRISKGNITSETRKYLLGKMYQAGLRASRSPKIVSILKKVSKIPIYSFYAKDIAMYIGKIYDISAPSVCIYDRYARAADILADKPSISISDILRGKEKISVYYIIKLSKMSNDNIQYLQKLFHKNFYKMAGYIYMTSNVKPFDNISKYSNKALIKQMPEFDPDAMITSLSFTIPTWIASIKKAVSNSDLTDISENARKQLQTQLIDLERNVSEILKKLKGDKKNG